MVGKVTWLPTRYSDRMFGKQAHTALARPKLVLRLITLSCIRRRRRHRHPNAPRFRRRFPV